MDEIAELSETTYTIGPHVLLVSERDPATAAAGAVLRDIREARGDCAGPIGIADAIARLTAGTGAGLVVIDLDGCGATAPDAIDALLAALDAAARHHAIESLVIVPGDLIDQVFAQVRSRRVEILATPESSERRAAIRALLAAGTMPRLRDVGSDNSAMRLLQLREEVARIARSLSTLSEPEPARAPREASPATEEIAIEAGTIRAMIRARRLRDQFFAPALFADPAWDMLLDLLAARLERRAVAVSSLCIAAAVPPTTALRWIRTLEDSHLIVRGADPADRRRVFVRLADEAVAALGRYFTAMQKAFQLPG